MTFEEILDQALAMLQRRGRVTFRTLQLQFQPDEDALEDLKTELIKAQRLAVDEDGEGAGLDGAARHRLAVLHTAFSDCHCRARSRLGSDLGYGP